jgi:hypothetical protein
MKPGDIVLLRDRETGYNRMWEIQGCFHGALGQESVIELKSLTERPAHSYETQEHPTTFVPEPLLRGAEIFTPASTPATVQ